jgi:hypothetical protein
MTHSEARLVEPAVARPAPAWNVERWFNAPDDFSLDRLRGRVVALHAFQMLCPGCVAHGIPQAQRIAASFASEEVAVVGLHTVFEHHEAMRPVSLAAFVHEYRISFPVGVDRASEDGPIPETMQRYGLRGTPSLVLIDRLGRLRLHAFGRPEDMTVGAAIASLVAEASSTTASSEGHEDADERSVGAGCSAEGCSV